MSPGGTCPGLFASGVQLTNWSAAVPPLQWVTLVTRYDELSLFAAAVVSLAWDAGFSSFPHTLIAAPTGAALPARSLVVADIEGVRGSAGLDAGALLAGAGRGAAVPAATFDGSATDAQLATSLGPAGVAARLGVYVSSAFFAWAADYGRTTLPQFSAAVQKPLAPSSLKAAIEATLFANWAAAHNVTADSGAYVLATLLHGNASDVRARINASALVRGLTGAYPVVSAAAAALCRGNASALTALGAMSAGVAPPSMLAALGLNFSCTHVASTAALEAALAPGAVAGAALNASTSYLVLAAEPWSGAATYKLVRLALPWFDPAAFVLAGTSDFPAATPVRKRATLDFEPALPGGIANFVRQLTLPNADVAAALAAARARNGSTVWPVSRKDIAIVLAAGGPMLTEVPHATYVFTAACAWLQANSKRVLDWGLQMTLSGIAPATGGTAGYEALTVTGWGFQDIGAGLVISVGGTPCITSTYSDEGAVVCMTPPGVGSLLNVTVLLGAQSQTLAAAFSYLPATIHGFETAEGGSITSGSQHSGDELVVIGAHFYPSANLQCRFTNSIGLSATVAATFASFSKLTCTPPAAYAGSVAVAVSNDGRIFTPGFALNLTLTKWAQGANLRPLDVGTESSPPLIKIALMLEESNLGPALGDGLFALFQNATAAVIAAYGLLPNTRVVTVRTPLEAPPLAAPGQTQAAFDLAVEQYAVRVSDTYASVRAANLQLVAIIGPRSDIATMAVLAAMKAYAVNGTYPPVLMIGVGASLPSLSNSTVFPYYLRIQPSELTQAKALAELVVFLQGRFMSWGVMPPSVASPIVDILYDTGYAEVSFILDAFAAFLATGGGIIRTHLPVSSLLSSTDFLAALRGSQIYANAQVSTEAHIILVLGSPEFIARAVTAGAALQMTGTRAAGSANAVLWIGTAAFSRALYMFPTVVGAAASLSLAQLAQTPAGIAGVDALLPNAFANSYGGLSATSSGTAPLIGPAVHDAAISLPFSSAELIRAAKNRSLAGYTAQLFAAGLRTVGLGVGVEARLNGTDPSWLQFGSFARTVNEPAIALFNVINTLAYSSAQMPADATGATVSQSLGVISAGTGITSKDFGTLNYMMANAVNPVTGAAQAYAVPARLAVMIPFPVHPSAAINATAAANPLAVAFSPEASYAVTWTRTASGIVSGLPAVYMGAAAGGAARTSFPANATVANPLTVRIPDNTLYGGQWETTAAMSLDRYLMPSIEALAEAINVDSSALGQKTKIVIYWVPFWLDQTHLPDDPLTQRNLAPALIEAMTTVSAMPQTSIIGVVLPPATAVLTSATLTALKASQWANLPVMGGATNLGYSNVSAYPTFVHARAPIIVEVRALLDTCRQAGWTKVGLIFSGVTDALFDAGVFNTGPEIYVNFVNEAARLNISIVSRVNVSQFLSHSTVAQAPARVANATLADVSPASHATDREAGLLAAMAGMRAAGARIVVNIAMARALCPILRAGFAASMFNTAPLFAGLDALADNVTAAYERLALLRTGAIPQWTIGDVDPLAPGISPAAAAARAAANSSWTLDATGLYESPRTTMRDSFQWLSSSFTTAAAAPVAGCPSMLPPDPWGQTGAAQPRDSAGNLRATFNASYDRLAGQTVNSTLLFGGLGILPSVGSTTELARITALAVARAGLPTKSNSSFMTLTKAFLLNTGPFLPAITACRALVVNVTSVAGSPLPAGLTNAMIDSLRAYSISPTTTPYPAEVVHAYCSGGMPVLLSPQYMSDWMDAERAALLATMPDGTMPSAVDLSTVPMPPNVQVLTGVTGGVALTTLLAQPGDMPAASSGALIVPASAWMLDFRTTIVRRGIISLLVAAAGAIADEVEPTDAGVVNTYLRSRTPYTGLISAPSLRSYTKTTGFDGTSNDPTNPLFDVISLQGPNATALVHAGYFSGRGYVRTIGCPPGMQPSSPFACALCPVDSYSATSSTDGCLPCPVTDGSSSAPLMSTAGASGVTSAAACVCPQGFYISPDTSTGVRCVRCTRVMRCIGVNVSLAAVYNAVGFWRGSPSSAVFHRCLQAADCPELTPTIVRAATSPAASWAALYGSGCGRNAEGPLCGSCAAGYGRVTDGSCAACSAASPVAALAAAVVVTLLVIFALAAVQLAMTPDYIALRRTMTVKALVNFLQVNAILLPVTIAKPASILQYLEVSNAVSAGALLWEPWTCVLKSRGDEVLAQIVIGTVVAPWVAALVVGLALLLTVAAVAACCPSYYRCCMRQGVAAAPPPPPLQPLQAPLKPRLRIKSSARKASGGTRFAAAASIASSSTDSAFHVDRADGSSDDGITGAAGDDDDGDGGGAPGDAQQRGEEVDGGGHDGAGLLPGAADLAADEDAAEAPGGGSLLPLPRRSCTRWWPWSSAAALAGRPAASAATAARSVRAEAELARLMVRTRPALGAACGDALGAALGISLFIFYPAIVRITLASLVCLPAGPTILFSSGWSDASSHLANATGDSDSFLAAAPTVSCSSPAYLSVWPAIVALAAVYTAGVPLLAIIAACCCGRPYLGRGRMRGGGAALELLAQRLQTLALWAGPTQRALLHRHFGDGSLPVYVRLRLVFDALHSPASVEQAKHAWRKQRALEVAAQAKAEKSAAAAAAAARAAASKSAGIIMPQNQVSGGGGSVVSGSAGRGVAAGDDGAVGAAPARRGSSASSTSDAASTGSEPAVAAAAAAVQAAAAASTAHSAAFISSAPLSADEDSTCDPALAALSFDVRPVSRADFLAGSELMRANYEAAILLEAAFEEASDIASRNAASEWAAAAPGSDGGSAAAAAAAPPPPALAASVAAAALAGSAPSAAAPAPEARAAAATGLRACFCARWRCCEAGALQARPVRLARALVSDTGSGAGDAQLAAALLETADRLRSVGAAHRRCAWLLIDYRPGAAAWEACNLARKAALVAAVATLVGSTASVQLMACVCVLLGYLALLVLAEPGLAVRVQPPVAPAQRRAYERAQLAAHARGGDERAPVSLGYLGRLQRRWMRLQATVALPQLDAAAPVLLAAATPDAAFVPDLLLAGGRSAVALAAAAASGSTDARALKAAGQAAAAARADAALAPPGLRLAPQPPLTPAQALATYPELAQPRHVGCCSAYARELSGSSSACACACPWWARAVRSLPDAAGYATLEYAGVIVQLMQLCLALVYQTWLEQSTVLAALSANSASDASPGTAIAVLILVLGGAYIAALAAAILIDAAGGLSRCAAMLCACGGARQLLRREGRALDVLRQREADILLRVCALEATLDLQRRGGRGHAGDLAAWQ